MAKENAVKKLLNRYIIGGAGALALVLLLSAILAGPLGFFMTSTVLLGIPILYFLLSLDIIGPREKAAKVRLGHPLKKREGGGELKSGVRVRLFGIEKFVKFTTEPVNLSLGQMRTYSEKSDHHQGAELIADVSIRFEWPSGDKLVEIVKRVSDPYNLEKVRGLFVEDCIEIVKEVLSSLDWETAYANRERIIDDRIRERLTRLQVSHILMLLNLDLTKVEFQILNVRVVPEDLIHAAARREIEEHNRATRTISAEAKKKEMELLGEGQARSVKMKVDAMGGPDNAVFTKVETTPEGEEKITIAGVPDSSGLEGLGRAVGEVLRGVSGGKDKPGKSLKKQVPIEGEDSK